MKRLHVSVAVDDLDASIRFYATLFDSAPSVRKPDYAKWMLDDPRVNFSLSTRAQGKGVSHLGIQVESEDELREVFGRLRKAEAPTYGEGDTTCCYANSEKSWINDPQGVPWETFLTTGDSPVYGTEVDPLEAPKVACCATGEVAESPAETCC